METVQVGFEVPSGDPVHVPLQHMAFYGLTQQAGKTTGLEGTLSRAEGVTRLILRTGRNEIPFSGAHAVRPFFRERYDWKYVEALLWSFLQERPKVYRTWVMRATQGARSLADVHAKIIAAGKKATRGWDQDLLYQLDHYFQEILPGLKSLDLSTELELHTGELHMMDLEGVNLPTQQLVVAAVLDYLMAHNRGTDIVVVLPEARDFLPSDRSTPAKFSADQFVRRGAKLGLYLWIDSQSLTGVDQQVVRNFGISLHGRQTSDLEIQRIVKAVGHSITAKTVKSLQLGEFLLEDKDGVRKVYVQPAWLPYDLALDVAMHTIDVADRRVEAARALERLHAQARKVTPPEETKVDARKEQEYRDRIAAQDDEIKRLNKRVEDLVARVVTESDRAEANARIAAAHAVEKIRATATPDSTREALKAYGVDPVLAELAPDAPRERIDLHVVHEVPNLTVHEKLVHVDVSTEESHGRLALLISRGFFDAQRLNSHVRDEFRSRNWGQWMGGGGQNSMQELLRQFCEWGFLREETANKRTSYQLVDGAKERVHTVKERMDR